MVTGGEVPVGAGERVPQLRVRPGAHGRHQRLHRGVGEVLRLVQDHTIAGEPPAGPGGTGDEPQPGAVEEFDAFLTVARCGLA